MSYDNLTKKQLPRKPSSKITVTKLFEGGGDMGAGGSHTDQDITVTPGVVGITPTSKLFFLLILYHAVLFDKNDFFYIFQSPQKSVVVLDV